MTQEEPRASWSQHLPTKAISLVLIFRNAGDVHVYRHGGRALPSARRGGLEALQFVQCFVEAALYGGLASGELGGYALLHIGDLFLG